MKIIHLSDTHGLHRSLRNMPPADLIIHSGDASEGTAREMYDFLNWFFGLDYRYKIFVAGNHDLCLYGERIENLPADCHYLCHSGVTIEGIQFWGVPYFASNESNDDTARLITQIPTQTEVLISHRPPYGILDFEKNENWGCLDLLQAVLKIQPRYHLFGHVHAGYGSEKMQNTTFVNASLISKKRIVHEPFAIKV